MKHRIALISKTGKIMKFTMKYIKKKKSTRTAEILGVICSTYFMCLGIIIIDLGI